MGIIAGATIGAGILLTVFFITLAFFLYRRRKGSEYGPRGEQPTPTASRVPSRQSLRVPGGGGVEFALPTPGGSRSDYCRGWQEASSCLPLSQVARM